MVCLNAAINNGGNVFTPMLMAKNVVPQKIETAANANQGNNKGCLFKIIYLASKVIPSLISLTKILGSAYPKYPTRFVCSQQDENNINKKCQVGK